MITSLEHLPEHKQKQLREITGIIVKAVDPEKVILFGSHATGRWVEHRYTEGGITYEYISDYDILVITKTGESRKDYEVQDVIENRCVYKTPVTVITHDILRSITHPSQYEHDSNRKTGADKQYGTKEERRVITGREQKTARALGEIKKGQVTRRNHTSQSTRVSGPTSTESTTERNIFNILKGKKDLQNEHPVTPPKKNNYCIGCDGPARPGGPISI